MPARLRRRPLITGLGAGILAAAVIAAVVLVVVKPGAQQAQYTTLPAACDMASAASLAKDLPGATAIRESIPVGTGVKAGFCKWSSIAAGQDRTLTSEVVLYGKSSAISAVRQGYTSVASIIGCHCKGVTASTRPVPGLGDQAEGVFVDAGPDANFEEAPNASFPGTNLVVRSSNALIILGFDTTVAATGESMAPQAGGAQLTGMIPVARSMLAALARPAAVSSAAIAPVSPEPHYAGQRDPCRLISAATLAKYAPGATLVANDSTPPSGSSPGTCSWGSDSNFIMVNLSVFPDAAKARQDYAVDIDGASGTGNGDETATGAQWLEDLGEQATAIFQTRSGTDGVELLVWSGNAEIEYWYPGALSPGSSRPDRATLLAGGITMARDGLAALASPAASAYPQGPLYASPRNTCALVKASTLARYASGATVEQVPGPGITTGPDISNCAWGAPNGDLFLSVSIYADPDSAQGAFELDVQLAHKNSAGLKYDGAQSVSGVGQQATAIFQTSIGSPAVQLFVWSGNAEIEMSYSDQPFGTPPLSRAGKLASDIAVIRDVLADLHKSAT